MTTPLRQQPFVEAEGCRVLSPEGVDYRDGAENDLLHILKTTTDLSSLSDELANAATGWAQRYHLSRARSNVLRGLNLTGCNSALEIGAGCGAITRYLGELGMVIDALEPELPRAAVARSRTRDLSTVEVFVGTINDTPTEPSYDLVLVVGVFEWVVGDGHDPDAGPRFIEALTQRLRPGGRLVIAIENQIGVKYLAGAPEDHSGRSFDGPEGYPFGAPARTFSRRTLEGMLRQGGLATRFFHVFPDYKMAKLVLDDIAFDQPELARFVRDAPPMPSPERGHVARRVADERNIWTTLCEAGLGAATANSFLIVAGDDDGLARSWPADRAAAMFANEDRLGEFAVQTHLRRHDDGMWWFERRHLTEGAQTRHAGALTHTVSDSPLLPLDHFRYAQPISELDRWRTGLLAWRDEVLAAHPSFATGAEIDLVPHNALVYEGGIQLIDREWRHADWTAEHVLARGLILAIPELATMAETGAYKGFPSVRDLLVDVGAELGLDPDGDWLERGRMRERALHRELQGRPLVDAAFDEETLLWAESLDRALATAVDPPEPVSTRRRPLSRLRHPVAGTRSLLRHLR